MRSSPERESDALGKTAQRDGQVPSWQEYAEDEARYRKIRAHAYMQQYEGFINRRKREKIFGEGDRMERQGRLAGAAGGPGQKYYH